MNGRSSSEHRKKSIGDPLHALEVGNGHVLWICSIGSTMPVSRTNFAMPFAGLLVSGICSFASIPTMIKYPSSYSAMISLPNS